MDNDLGYFVYRKCNTDDSNIDFGLLNQQRMFDANHHYIYNRQKEMVYGNDEIHICYTTNYCDEHLSDTIKELDNKNKLKLFKEFR